MSDLVKLFFAVIRGSIRFYWYLTKPCLALWPPVAFLAKSEKGVAEKNLSPQSWVRNFFLVKLETLYYQLVKKSDPPTEF